MPISITSLPATDPTPIFELYRGVYGTELLCAAVAHLNLFAELAGGPLSFDGLRGRLQLAERPATVLFTVLRAMGLLTRNGETFDLTPIAREHLLPGGPFYVGDYVGLLAQSAGVLEMVHRLRTNRPAGADESEAGAAFIYRDGIASAMEQEASARSLTLALAGRAKNVAPALAGAMDLTDVRTLTDVAGGTGLYAIALLQRHPQLRATVFDRAEVLKVAAEFAQSHGVQDRLTLTPGDMFRDPIPPADVVLLSNVLHDWDVPECRTLVQRCAAALPAGGRLLIHDVFLNDALDGPLPLALYSAALFTQTEGRAYSAAEYRAWLTEAGLSPQRVIPTLVHCGVLAGMK
jgi:hypothetical protein